MSRACYGCGVGNAGDDEHCRYCGSYLGKPVQVERNGRAVHWNGTDEVAERKTCMRCGAPVVAALYCSNCRSGIKSTLDMIRERHRRNFSE
jgi:ribosomal protein L40E